MCLYIMCLGVLIVQPQWGFLSAITPLNYLSTCVYVCVCVRARECRVCGMVSASKNLYFIGKVVCFLSLCIFAVYLHCQS